MALTQGGRTAYICVGSIVFAFFMLPYFAVLWYRKNPEIKNRNLFLISCFAVFNATIALSYYIRPVVASWPCLLNVWVPISANLVVWSCEVFSGLRLIFFYLVSEEKVNNALVPSQKLENPQPNDDVKNKIDGEKDSLSATQSGAFSNFAKRIRLSGRKNIVDPEAPGSQFQLPWWWKYRRLMRDETFTIAAFAVLFFSILLNIVIQMGLGWWTLTTAEGPCPMVTLAKIPLSVIRPIISFLIEPMLLWFMRRMNDGYQMRFQILANDIVAVLTLVGVWIFEFWAINEIKARYGAVVTGGEAVAIVGAIGNQVFFVVLPLVRAIQHDFAIRGNHWDLRRASSVSETSSTTNRSSTTTATQHKMTPKMTRQSFSAILGDDEMLAELMRWCVKDFCTENLVFLLTYRSLASSVHTHLVEIGDVGALSAAAPRSSALPGIGKAVRSARDDSSTPGELLAPPVQSAGRHHELDARYEMPAQPVPPALMKNFQDCYDMFLVGGADYELNVPSHRVAQVQKAFANKPVLMNVFDETKRDVLQMLYENTYRKWVHSLAH